VGRLYAKDVAGVTKLAFRDHAGTETVLGSGSGGSSAGHSLLHNPDFRIATRGTSFTSAGNFPNNDGAYLLDGACCSRTATTSPMSIKSSPPFLWGHGGDREQEIRLLVSHRSERRQTDYRRHSLAVVQGTQGRQQRDARLAARSDHILVGDRGCNYPGCGERHELGRGWHKSDPRSELDLREHSSESRAHHLLSGVQDRERSIDTASAKNVGVFIWTDDTNATVNDIVYLADINLVPGAVATSYMPRAFAQQRVMCGRFLPHWRADGASFNIIALGYSDSSTNTFAAVPFFTPARVAVAGAVVSAAGDFRVRAEPRRHSHAYRHHLQPRRRPRMLGEHNLGLRIDRRLRA